MNSALEWTYKEEAMTCIKVTSRHMYEATDEGLKKLRILGPPVQDLNSVHLEHKG